MWAHLISDESLEELHAFARRLDLPPRAFGGDHYDITDELRDCAIAEGALPVDSRTIVRALHAAGLRKRPAATAHPGVDDSPHRAASVG